MQTLIYFIVTFSNMEYFIAHIFSQMASWEGAPSATKNKPCIKYPIKLKIMTIAKILFHCVPMQMQLNAIVT